MQIQSEEVEKLVQSLQRQSTMAVNNMVKMNSNMDDILTNLDKIDTLSKKLQSKK